MKNFKFLLIMCLSFAVFLSVSCEKKEQTPQGSNVSFTPCKQGVLRSNNSSEKVDVEFTNKGVQITHYNFEVSCDFTAVNVTHTFANGVLRITQQGYPNQANCICYTDVSYTIDGISQNEVNVIFINGVQVYCYNENYSVWKCTEYEDIVIELTFNQYDGKVHLETTPEELPNSFLLRGNVIADYYIVDNKMYWKNPEDSKYNDNFFWYIFYLSNSEMDLEFGGFMPLAIYITKYHFIRQIN